MIGDKKCKKKHIKNYVLTIDGDKFKASWVKTE